MAKLEIDFDEVNKLVDGPTANITDETNCHSTATNENKNTNENKETNENKLKLNQNGIIEKSKEKTWNIYFLILKQYKC